MFVSNKFGQIWNLKFIIVKNYFVNDFTVNYTQLWKFMYYWVRADLNVSPGLNGWFHRANQFILLCAQQSYNIKYVF